MSSATGPEKRWNRNVMDYAFNRSKLRGFRAPNLFPVLPTMLTLGNAVCGLGSITFAVKVGPAGSESTYLFISGMLIFAAMLFDMLDGSAARWTRQTSQFGAELDSLSDVISFGVAPAFILLRFSANYHPRVLWVIAALFTICTVLRLARFNVETKPGDPHDSFSGLPSPAAAATMASFVLAGSNLSSMPVPDFGRWGFLSEAGVMAAARNALPVVSLVLSGLMVSRIRYPHFFNQVARGRRKFQHLMQMIFAIAAVFTIGELAVPLLLCAFAVGSPLRAAWQRLGASPQGPPSNRPQRAARPKPQRERSQRQPLKAFWPNGFGSGKRRA